MGNGRGRGRVRIRGRGRGRGFDYFVWIEVKKIDIINIFGVIKAFLSQGKFVPQCALSYS